MSSELTADQQLALEEYKILIGQLDSSESLFNKWESGYLIANGFIITLFGTLMSKDDTVTILVMKFVLCFLGGIISYQWSRILGRSLLYSFAREERLRQLEKFLNKVTKYPGSEESLTLFQTAEYIKKYVYSHPKKWNNNTSTYKIRLQLPVFFIWLWICLPFITFLVFICSE